MKREDMIAECKKLGVVTWNLASLRMKYYGWSYKEAISLPVNYRKKNDEFYKKYGVTKKTYCDIHNIKHYYTFCYRIDHGMSIEDASKPPRYFLKGRSTKPIKYWVFYKNEKMPLSKAFRELVDDTGAFVTRRCYASVMSRVRKNGQTLQQAFDHIVKLYHRKYKRD